MMCILASKEIHGPIIKLWNFLEYDINKTNNTTPKFKAKPIIVSGKIGKEIKTPLIVNSTALICIKTSNLTIKATIP
ncbi:hypothetical protein SDC9_176930 [bioreactor metagenome]|uniref:Uncharacterized protein n=1 Tax=bioreactor metagenome TaxID=1076179 RepID=A0A645GRE5_9ZZZZ